MATEPIGRPTTASPAVVELPTITTPPATPQGVSVVGSTLEPATPGTTESKGFCSRVGLCFKSIADTIWNAVSKALTWIKGFFKSGEPAQPGVQTPQAETQPSEASPVTIPQPENQPPQTPPVTTPQPEAQPPQTPPAATPQLRRPFSLTLSETAPRSGAQPPRTPPIAAPQPRRPLPQIPSGAAPQPGAQAPQTPPEATPQPKAHTPRGVEASKEEAVKVPSSKGSPSQEIARATPPSKITLSAKEILRELEGELYDPRFVTHWFTDSESAREFFLEHRFGKMPSAIQDLLTSTMWELANANANADADEDEDGLEMLENETEFAWGLRALKGNAGDYCIDLADPDGLLLCAINEVIKTHGEKNFELERQTAKIFNPLPQRKSDKDGKVITTVGEIFGFIRATLHRANLHKGDLEDVRNLFLENLSKQPSTIQRLLTSTMWELAVEEDETLLEKEKSRDWPLLVLSGEIGEYKDLFAAGSLLHRAVNQIIQTSSEELLPVDKEILALGYDTFKILSEPQRNFTIREMCELLKKESIDHEFTKDWATNRPKARDYILKQLSQIPPAILERLTSTMWKLAGNDRADALENEAPHAWGWRVLEGKIEKYEDILAPDSLMLQALDQLDAVAGKETFRLIPSVTYRELPGKLDKLLTSPRFVQELKENPVAAKAAFLTAGFGKMPADVRKLLGSAMWDLAAEDVAGENDDSNIKRPGQSEGERPSAWIFRVFGGEIEKYADICSYDGLLLRAADRLSEIHGKESFEPKADDCLVFSVDPEGKLFIVK